MPKSLITKEKLSPDERRAAILGAAFEVFVEHGFEAATKIRIDEADLNESIELPGADLSDESITVMVIPKKADEFTCSRCFLVNHRSQLARETKTEQICRDCA